MITVLPIKIVELMERIEADLVILGAHSNTVLGRLFLESNTDYVVHHVHFPMNICKFFFTYIRVFVPIG